MNEQDDAETHAKSVAHILATVNESLKAYTDNGCTGHFVDSYLMDATHPLFDSIHELIALADECDSVSWSPLWRNELEGKMTERWEDFAQSVAFFLDRDCYDKVDEEIESVAKWIRTTYRKYFKLLKEHVDNAEKSSGPPT